jgi:hypothetical protein
MHTQALMIDKIQAAKMTIGKAVRRGNTALIADLLIEAARVNNYELVEFITTKPQEIQDHHTSAPFQLWEQRPKLFITDDIIKKHIINCFNNIFDLNNPAKLIPSPTQMELVLCAMDSPNDVLKIIIDYYGHICTDINPCTGLILNTYFFQNIYPYFKEQKSGNLPLGFFHSNALNEKIISPKMKFLCDVLVEFFPTEDEVIQRLKTIIFKHNLQDMPEFKKFCDFVQSQQEQEQGKDTTRLKFTG